MAEEIDFEELKDNKDDFIIIDVRNPGEVEATGHIPGAKNIPLGELENAFKLDDDTFSEKYGFDKPQEDASIVSHCQNGGRAKKAGDLLAAAGRAVKVYVGSFNDWKANGGEVAPGRP